MSRKKSVPHAAPTPEFTEPFTKRFKEWKPGPCKTACEKELRALMNDVEVLLIVERRALTKEVVMKMFDEAMLDRDMYPSL